MPVSLTFVSILGFLIMDVTNTEPIWTPAKLIHEVIQSVGDPISMEQGADMAAGEKIQCDWSMCEEAARRITAEARVTYTAIGNTPDACQAYQVRIKPGESIRTWNLVRCPGQPQEFFIRNYRHNIHVPQYTRVRRPVAAESSSGQPIKEERDPMAGSSYGGPIKEEPHK